MTTDPEHIEERIETTRARLSQNLGELGDRMSPGNLVDEALHYFDTGPKEFAGSLGNQVRENPMAALLTAAGVAWMAMGRGRDPMRPYADARVPHSSHDDDYDDDHDNDGDRYGTSGHPYSRFDSERYRDDTTGEASFYAGTSTYSAPDGRSYDLSEDEYVSHQSDIDTYRSIETVRHSTPRTTDESDSAYYRRLDDTYASTLKIERNDGEDDDTYRARIRAATDTAAEKARAARRSLKDSARRTRLRMADMARDARYRAGEFGDNMRGRASDMSDEAAYRARMAKRRAAEFHDENPLVSGAIAVAVGAVAGALFPVSQQERDALAPVADDLIDRGATLAEQAAERVEAHADTLERKVDELADASPLEGGASYGSTGYASKAG